MKNVQLTKIIEALPPYTQISILYQLVGSLNATMINLATREVSRQANALDKTAAATSSIDRYNEYVAELRSHDQDAIWNEISGQELRPDPVADNSIRLAKLHNLRTPLLAILNATQATVPPNPDYPYPDFSFAGSLANQLTREYTPAKVMSAIAEELIKSGALTQEDLIAAGRLAFNQDMDMKKEFKFLILDRLHETENDAGLTADEAFNSLPEEQQTRILERMLPKLHAAKIQQARRIEFDMDAGTNIYIINAVMKMIEEHTGHSDAKARLLKLQASLKVTEIKTPEVVPETKPTIAPEALHALQEKFAHA